MNRIKFITISLKFIGATWLGINQFSCSFNNKKTSDKKKGRKEFMLERHGDKPIEKLNLNKEEWKERLNNEQFYILREEGTEQPFSSSLNKEKREGVFYCVGCDLDLFTSKMKYDSGTGWPSFFTAIPNRFEIKKDFKLVFPRQEYHCIRCGGHHGHVFKDGPQPTFERWCNNGIALTFNPEKI